MEPIQGLQASAMMLTAFSICFVSTRILDAPRSRHEKFMRSIRGNKISMIFQEPMTALNPLYTVEKQVAEVLKQHNSWMMEIINIAMKIGKAIISPTEIMVNFFRNDWRSALPLLATLLFILLSHQTNIADLILRIFSSQITLFVLAIVFVNWIFWNIFRGNIEVTELS